MITRDPYGISGAVAPGRKPGRDGADRGAQYHGAGRGGGG